jgi:hypothetical protein
MTIQNGPDGAILVDLPEEPALEEELHEVVRLVRTLVACDVVVDFSHVTVFNSACLASLLRYATTESTAAASPVQRAGHRAFVRHRTRGIRDHRRHAGRRRGHSQSRPPAVNRHRRDEKSPR